MNAAGKDIFQVIADPTRRAILGMLRGTDMTPNAMAEYFHSTRQAVSKHVQVLADSGLVKARQSGREIRYRINVKRLREVDEWLRPFRASWDSRFSQLDELLEKNGRKNKTR